MDLNPLTNKARHSSNYRSK